MNRLQRLGHGVVRVIKPKRPDNFIQTEEDKLEIKKLEKENLTGVKEYDLNFGDAIENYVAGISAMKLDAKEFEYEGLPDGAEEELREVFLANSMKKRRKELGRKLSKTGFGAFVLEKDEMGKPYIKVAKEVTKYEFRFNKLVLIEVMNSQVFEVDGGQSNLFTEYQLKNDGRVHIRRYIYQNQSQKGIDLSKYNLPENEVLETDEIPVELFTNNEENKPDLFYVKGIVDFTSYLANEFGVEWDVSKTKFVLNKIFMAGQNDDDIKKKILSSTERFITIRSADGQFGTAIGQFFTMGKLTELREMFDMLIKMVLSYSFTPANLEDNKSNNKHNLENRMKQQMALEYLDNKKELREEAYTKFIRKLLRFMGYKDVEGVFVQLISTEIDAEIKGMEEETGEVINESNNKPAE